MDLSSNDQVTRADLEMIRQRQETARALLGIDIEELRRGAAEGRIRREVVARVEQQIKASRPFLNIDVDQEIRRLEREGAARLQTRPPRARVAEVPKAPSPSVADLPGSSDHGHPQLPSARTPDSRVSAPAAAPGKVVRRRVRRKAQVPPAPQAAAPAMSAAAPAPRILPQQIAPLVAGSQARARRQQVVAFLRFARMEVELAHLEAVEERLIYGGTPAHSHAALSTRLLFKGVADQLFPPQVERWRNRSGAYREVGEKQVGNRLIAYVEHRLGPELSNKDLGQEFKLFIATIDTLNRWSGRGPHLVRDPYEATKFFLRTLDALDFVARAYLTPRCS